MGNKTLILQQHKKAIQEKEIRVNLIAKRDPKQQARIIKFKSKTARIHRD